MKASEILSKAATELRAHGHVKFDLQDRAGHVCVLGAINLAYHGHSDYPRGFATETPPDYAVAVATLHAFLECDTVAHGWGDESCRKAWDLVHWNNADVRTGAEVIDALEGAAGAAALTGG